MLASRYVVMSEADGSSRCTLSWNLNPSFEVEEVSIEFES